MKRREKHFNTWANQWKKQRKMQLSRSVNLDLLQQFYFRWKSRKWTVSLSYLIMVNFSSPHNKSVDRVTEQKVRFTSINVLTRIALHVSVLFLSAIYLGRFTRVLDYQRNYYAIRYKLRSNVYINMHGVAIETCAMLVQLVAREFTISHSIWASSAVSGSTRLAF